MLMLLLAHVKIVLVCILYLQPAFTEASQSQFLSDASWEDNLGLSEARSSKSVAVSVSVV